MAIGLLLWNNAAAAALFLRIDPGAQDNHNLYESQEDFQHIARTT
jgi:hypothetical protein